VSLFHAANPCVSVPCNNSTFFCSMQQIHVSLFYVTFPCFSVPCSNFMCLCSMQQFHVSMFHTTTEYVYRIQQLHVVSLLIVFS
jgi:hypothetical protein